MKTISQFLDEAKNTTGSDYATAKLMGVTRSSLSNYRAGRSMPDQYAVFQLADILKIDEVDLFICLGAEGEKNPAKKAYWEKRAGGFADIWMMAGGSCNQQFDTGRSITIGLHRPTGFNLGVCTLYIMLNYGTILELKIKPTKGNPSTGFFYSMAANDGIYGISNVALLTALS